MILCLNKGSVAKLVVVGSEFQILTTFLRRIGYVHPYYSATWRVYMHALRCHYHKIHRNPKKLISKRPKTIL